MPLPPIWQPIVPETVAPFAGEVKETPVGAAAYAAEERAMAAGNADATARLAFFRHSFFRLCMFFLSVHNRDFERLLLFHGQVDERDGVLRHFRNLVFAVELVARANGIALLAARQEHGELA